MRLNQHFEASQQRQVFFFLAGGLLLISLFIHYFLGRFFPGLPGAISRSLPYHVGIVTLVQAWNFIFDKN